MKVGDPIFPDLQRFTFEKLGDVSNPQLPLYFGCVSFMEHSGTHMDAPAHAVAEAPWAVKLTCPRDTMTESDSSAIIVSYDRLPLPNVK